MGPSAQPALDQERRARSSSSGSRLMGRSDPPGSRRLVSFFWSASRPGDGDVQAGRPVPDDTDRGSRCGPSWRLPGRRSAAHPRPRRGRPRGPTVGAITLSVPRSSTARSLRGGEGVRRFRDVAVHAASIACQCRPWAFAPPATSPALFRVHPSSRRALPSPRTAAGRPSAFKRYNAASRPPCPGRQAIRQAPIPSVHLIFPGAPTTAQLRDRIVPAREGQLIVEDRQSPNRQTTCSHFAEWPRPPARPRAG